MNSKSLILVALLVATTGPGLSKQVRQEVSPFATKNEKFTVESVAKVAILSSRNPDPKIGDLNLVNVESSGYKLFYIVQERSRGPGLLEDLSSVVVSKKTGFVYAVLPSADLRTVKKWCDRNLERVTKTEETWLAKSH